MFSSGSIRETVESVIVALVLAFLFRTFEAEAFVIPTGSMAPTLMGKHKDVECPACRHRYQLNASDQTDHDTNSPRLARVVAGACPMCRFTADLAPGNIQRQSYESYDGDRILVAKFPFEFSEPERWDVVVFKFPGDSTMNYIKRLVGKPGETIRIKNGDLWIRPDRPDAAFAIARKPPAKILAMLQTVYDNDLAPTISGEMNWPARWSAWPGDGPAWTNPARGNGSDLSAFEIAGDAATESWIRYRHLVPSAEQWRSVLRGASGGASPAADRPQWLSSLKAAMIPADQVPPRLVSDFAAYNSASDSHSGQDEFRNGLHWVGDLAVQFELEVKTATGRLILELVKGGRRFRCGLDLAAGAARMSISGEEEEARRFHPGASTPIAPGRHTVTFSNVDDELRLWIDGSPVDFDAPTQYSSKELNNRIPTADDLAPVGIGASGASVEIRHLKVLRDVYYIAEFCHGSIRRQNHILTDFRHQMPDLANPSDWADKFSDENMEVAEIALKPSDPSHPEKDRFFVLGDNSPQSSDGRLWAKEWWVDRELLIGKALFIYWPHGWGIPGVQLPVNIVPYFQRMHLVR